MSSRCSWLTIAWPLFVLAAGCSGKPGPLIPPTIPENAGQAAVEKYDANGDGLIGGEELSSIPAFKASLKQIDVNKDGAVSADEIDARIAAWKKSRVAIARVSAKVTQGGRPLAGAQVRLVPEEFLGPAVKSAQATTDAIGNAYLQISSSRDEAGVHLGFFRVEITKPGADGKEQLAPKFNEATQLGVEVAPDDPDSTQLSFDVSGN